MTQDLVVVSTGYDWYSSWAENSYLGENYIYGQFIWNYYWKFIQTANNMITVVDPENATDEQLGYLGVGHAFRALAYLDMAQMYEFLPNDAISGLNAAGNRVDSLTVPIVREGMTEEEARNNPRAPRSEMAEFILEDLTKAEDYIVNLQEASKVIPHLDAVYGLFARYYMWLGDYTNAKLYARKAIDNSSVQPMSESACLDLVSGFNTLDAWMWGAATQAEDDVVKTATEKGINILSTEMSAYDTAIYLAELINE
jgi:tetratricopeptide (TPR) repeat protein